MTSKNDIGETNLFYVQNDLTVAKIYVCLFVLSRTESSRNEKLIDSSKWSFEIIVHEPDTNVSYFYALR